ncbi:similar to KIAA0335, isoform CRA_a [Rattus norvegicus]|uniref:Similar to KIAA0335, isoform CRA_a n=1 Tax=Rattus norvegicus TaxID=10116 RepID=A6JH66_RAT|nr:similar to KIAA0335, isoform CRA_a [Rattus norvegicus]
MAAIWDSQAMGTTTDTISFAHCT